MAGLKLLELAPDRMPDYLLPAWVEFLRNVAQDASTVADFKSEANLKNWPALTPIDIMVDEASEGEKEIFRQFVKWVNAELWVAKYGESARETPTDIERGGKHGKPGGSCKLDG